MSANCTFFYSRQFFYVQNPKFIQLLIFHMNEVVSKWISLSCHVSFQCFPWKENEVPTIVCLNEVPTMVCLSLIISHLSSPFCFLLFFFSVPITACYFIANPVTHTEV
ncbi:hypothetical protein CEXT_133461 [Caerostris extrusa]|uniref:Uncharacterized protein n=1 Tax=Caerostris extrusa TaxID=172846 RepID=A0AAV4MER5_CAEEX|nr:hypothetical protein CEXT_133461 [Caerostris extrusa]